MCVLYNTAGHWVCGMCCWVSSSNGSPHCRSPLLQGHVAVSPSRGSLQLQRLSFCIFYSSSISVSASAAAPASRSASLRPQVLGRGWLGAGVLKHPGVIGLPREAGGGHRGASPRGGSRGELCQPEPGKAVGTPQAYGAVSSPYCGSKHAGSAAQEEAGRQPCSSQLPNFTLQRAVLLLLA